MEQRPRIYYSESEKALMWERRKQGWTLHENGKLFDRGHKSVQRIFAETGGGGGRVSGVVQRCSVRGTLASSHSAGATRSPALH